MPLLYGEGLRAFYRLQEEIMKLHDDYTLFAWIEPRASKPGHCNPPLHSSASYHADGILAASPYNFSNEKWPVPWWPYRELHSISKAILFAEVKCSIWGEWIVHPPTLTSRGLSIGLPLRRKSERVYQACVAFTSSLRNNHFLCLTLSPYLNDTAFTPGFQVYTIEDTGTLEFVPQAELRDNLFKYTSIYLTYTSYPSAIIQFIPREIMRSQPGESLKIQLDENCSVLDSFVMRRDPAFVVLPPDEFMLGYSSNGETLKAIFRIGLHGFSSSFIVAFGTQTRKNEVPWCDILFQPQVQDDDNLGIVPAGLGLTRSEDTRSTTRNADFGRYVSKDLETASKMFEEPLSKIFGALGRGPNQKLFNAASDRVVKTLPGVTLNVSARRTYKSVGNLPIFCDLCANRLQESEARYTLNISAQIAAGESSRSLKPSKL